MSTIDKTFKRCKQGRNLDKSRKKIKIQRTIQSNQQTLDSMIISKRSREVLTEGKGSVDETDNLTDVESGLMSSQEEYSQNLPSCNDVCSYSSLSTKRKIESKLVVKKQIKDNVHGCIEFEPLCIRIIDTPQFQRLRNLHQLGAAYFVYMGATHSRFEHCLGVAHLAEELVSSIMKEQPYLNITRKDMLCVKIAGLCHDLGHGPFSHVFDGIFMKNVRSATKQQDWKHENGSIDMLDHIIKKNCIEIADYGLNSNDYLFIKEMILGEGLGDSNEFIGRGEDKAFLYDIVNNTKSGLDVDKLDYFIRDAKMTGVYPCCDVHLILKSARVLPDREDPKMRLTVCFPEKFVEQLLKLFRTRFELHQEVYQHKGVKAIEHMISDTLIAADPYIRFRGCKISDSPCDMNAYELLDDRILVLIQLSDSPELQNARDLYNRVLTKNAYKFVGKTSLQVHSSKMSREDIISEICSLGKDSKLLPGDVIVDKLYIHHGKGKKDPISFVRFYSKDSSSSDCCYKLHPELYQQHMPKMFMEESVRLFVRDPRKFMDAKECFGRWCHEVNNSEPSSFG